MEATLRQSAHTLTLLADLGVNKEQLKLLHDGYLADLVRAVRYGIIGTREDFGKQIGLRGVIDCQLTVEQMVKRWNYITCRPFGLPKGFWQYRKNKPKGKVGVEWRIFTFCTEEQFTGWGKWENDGWMFAGTEHLLSYGAQNVRCINQIAGLNSATGNGGQFWTIKINERGDRLLCPMFGPEIVSQKTSCLMFRYVD